MESEDRQNAHMSTLTPFFAIAMALLGRYPINRKNIKEKG
jgi:hypothetical protein